MKQVIQSTFSDGATPTYATMAAAGAAWWSQVDYLVLLAGMGLLVRLIYDAIRLWRYIFNRKE